MAPFAQSLIEYLLRKNRALRQVDENYFAQQSGTPGESQYWRDIARRRRSEPMFALVMLEYWADFNRFAILIDLLREAGEDAVPVMRAPDGDEWVVNALNERSFELTGGGEQFADASIGRGGSGYSVGQFMRWWETAMLGLAPGKANFRAEKSSQTSGIQSFSGRFGTAINQAAHAPVTSVLSPYRVDCQNAGYRLVYTPEYWMNPTAFGSKPSTPVRGLLHKGRYKFGGTPPGSGSAITWDAIIHEVSDTVQRTLLTAI